MPHRIEALLVITAMMVGALLLTYGCVISVSRLLAGDL